MLDRLAPIGAWSTLARSKKLCSWFGPLYTVWAARPCIGRKANRIPAVQATSGADRVEAIGTANHLAPASEQQLHDGTLGSQDSGSAGPRAAGKAHNAQAERYAALGRQLGLRQ